MKLPRWLLSLFAWLLVGLVFATQLYLFARRTGGQMGWTGSLLWELPRWCLWALLAPLIIALAHRYPLRRRNAARLIAFHIFCAILLSLLHLVLFVLVFYGLRWVIGDRENILNIFQFAFPLDFHVGVAVYGIILLLKQSKDSEQRVARLQAELSQAQLEALKMQLHPHFLFNTLNSISSFLRTDVEVADEMIGQLGDFLRLTLQNPGTQEIELEKELEFLKRYLAIEQLRFQDKLDAQFDIDPETLPALVPNFILQPVVENAVRHGVSAKSGTGTIRIAAKRLNERLQILIYDSGPGLPHQIKEGIGISTTRDRLRHLYGTAAHLSLANQPEGGAVVTFGLPFRISEASH